MKKKRNKEMLKISEGRSAPRKALEGSKTQTMSTELGVQIN